MKKNQNERIEDNIKSNLLNRKFIIEGLNKVCDTEIMYLIFKGSRVYLFTIIGLYDKCVITYKISKHNDDKLVMDILNESLTKKKMYIDLSFTVFNDSDIHLISTKLFVNQIEYKYL